MKNYNRRLTKAWGRYLKGEIGPWDFQAVVESCGYWGWSGQSDGTVIIHCTEKIACTITP